MIDLITQKYPNTNYSGIMLDYYIKKLNETIKDVNGFKLEYTETSLKLIDGTGEVLSEIPFNFNPGNVIINRIMNEDSSDTAPFIGQIIQLEIAESAAFVSAIPVSTMIELMHQGNIIQLNHYKSRSRTIESLTASFPIVGYTVNYESKEIMFQYTFQDTQGLLGAEGLLHQFSFKIEDPAEPDGTILVTLYNHWVES